MAAITRTTVLAAAVVLAACGGGDPEPVDVPQPSAACADAFAAAVPERDVVDVPEDGERLDTTALARLAATLEDCANLEDWLSGARDHPEALPSQMDRVTALRFLCDGDHSTPACEQLLVPDDELGN